MRLTQAAVQGFKLPHGKTEAILFDDDLPGFGVRVRAGGSRGWIVQYKLGEKHRRLTLGSVKMLAADKARSTAKDLLARVRLGGDPANDKAAARLIASETFDVLAGRFLTRQESRLRAHGYAETERYLRRYLSPLHGLTLTSIVRSTVAGALASIARDHGPTSADRARAALSSMFAWAVGEGLCDANPVIGTNKAADSKTRDRVLTDAELAAIWRGAPNSDFGRIVQLLILTGCRRDEIGSLAWPEVDTTRRLIALPGSRTKNHRDFEVPLSESARAIIKACHRHDGRDLVFGEGEGGFQGWSRAKDALDKSSRVKNWTLHDLRRTAATRMADLGVPPHIIEACLNHVSGAKAGIAGVYNRSVYAKEKREAVELWGRRVAVLVKRRPIDS